MRLLPRNEAGAAVIEFALLLLLLIPLLFGIIEFGFLWAQSHYLSQAAREGARVGAGIAIYDSDANQISNQLQVQTVVDSTVKACLETASFYQGRVDKIATIAPFKLVFVGTNQPSLEVSVTVNSAAVWQPVLWQLLTLIPSSHGEHSEIKEMTDTAVFAISGH